MKNRIELKMHYRSGRIVLIVILFIWGLGMQASAQSCAGLKFGVSSPDISPTSFLVMDQGIPYYEVAVDHANYGVHGGIFLQIQMGHFFIQPELLYNSSSIQYKVDTLNAPETGTARFTDTHRSLDLPFMLGFKAGACRIGAGPVGHMLISSASGFDGYDGYQPTEDKFSWGWQGGIGFDFWKLHFDFRYESNYSTLGDNITFFGKSYDFATDNNRFIGSIGLSF